MPTTKTRKASPARASRRSRRTFDATDSADWHAIPSKGQLYALAIAAFEGADFPGADLLRSRDAAKELISQLKEQGFGIK